MSNNVETTASTNISDGNNDPLIDPIIAYIIIGVLGGLILISCAFCIYYLRKKCTEDREERKTLGLFGRQTFKYGPQIPKEFKDIAKEVDLARAKSPRASPSPSPNTETLPQTEAVASGKTDFVPPPPSHPHPFNARAIVGRDRSNTAPDALHAAAATNPMHAGHRAHAFSVSPHANISNPQHYNNLYHNYAQHMQQPQQPQQHAPWMKNPSNRLQSSQSVAMPLHANQQHPSSQPQGPQHPPWMSHSERFIAIAQHHHDQRGSIGSNQSRHAPQQYGHHPRPALNAQWMSHSERVLQHAGNNQMQPHAKMQLHASMSAHPHHPHHPQQFQQQLQHQSQPTRPWTQGPRQRSNTADPPSSQKVAPWMEQPPILSQSGSASVSGTQSSHQMFQMQPHVSFTPHVTGQTEHEHEHEQPNELESSDVHAQQMQMQNLSGDMFMAMHETHEQAQDEEMQMQMDEDSDSHHTHTREEHSDLMKEDKGTLYGVQTMHQIHKFIGIDVQNELNASDEQKHSDEQEQEHDDSDSDSHHTHTREENSVDQWIAGKKTLHGIQTTREIQQFIAVDVMKDVKGTNATNAEDLEVLEERSFHD